jgi:hypothetical protein
MKQGYKLSSYSNGTATIVYFISMLCFLLLIIAFGEPLIGLFIIVIMAMFSLQWHFLKFITLENDFILIKSIFKKDIQKKIDLYDDVNEVFFFRFILMIKFKDGRRYYFGGQNPGRINNFILENKHLFPLG